MRPIHHESHLKMKTVASILVANHSSNKAGTTASEMSAAAVALRRMVLETEETMVAADLFSRLAGLAPAFGL